MKDDGCIGNECHGTGATPGKDAQTRARFLRNSIRLVRNRRHVRARRSDNRPSFCFDPADGRHRHPKQTRMGRLGLRSVPICTASCGTARLITIRQLREIAPRRCCDRSGVSGPDSDILPSGQITRHPRS